MDVSIDKKKKLSCILAYIRLNITLNVERSQKAVKMLLNAGKSSKSDELQFLAKLHEALQICLENERIFCSILEFFLEKPELTLQYVFMYCDVKTPLLTVLREAFAKFQHVCVLQKITAAMRKVIECSPRYICVHLTETFETQYAKFLQAETSAIIESNETESLENPVIKMDILMRRFFFFLDYFQYEAVTIVNMKYLQTPEEPSFPFIARFHTTVLRTMWNIINESDDKTKPMTLPYDLNFIADAVADLAGKLMNFLGRRDLNLLQAQYIFSTLMELLFYFYIPPTLVNNGKRCVFLNQPKVSSKQMKDIAEFAEFYVFQIDLNAVLGTDDENLYDLEFQKEMLMSLAELIKNNNKLPNVSAVFKLVQFYHEKSKFKDELEMLLQSLLNRESTFNETIGLVVFHFAREEASIEEFTDFSSLLDEFFLQCGSLKNLLESKHKICVFVLNQLTSFIRVLSRTQEDDRLLVLNFLMEFADGIESEKLKAL